MITQENEHLINAITTDLDNLAKSIFAIKDSYKKLLDNTQETTTQEPLEASNVDEILLTSKLFNTQEINDLKARGVLDIYKNYLNTLGQVKFTEVLTRVVVQSKNVKHKESYILKALEHEAKGSTLRAIINNNL